MACIALAHGSGCTGNTADQVGRVPRMSIASRGIGDTALAGGSRPQQKIRKPPTKPDDRKSAVIS